MVPPDGTPAATRLCTDPAWAPVGMVTLVHVTSPRRSLPAMSARLALGAKVYSPRSTWSCRARAQSLNSAAERITPSRSSCMATWSTVAPFRTSRVRVSEVGPSRFQLHAAKAGGRARRAVATRRRVEVRDLAIGPGYPGPPAA